MKLYVKKIWSTNPNKYKYMELEKATEEYGQYALSVQDNPFFRIKIKTFSYWLRTEI